MPLIDTCSTRSEKPVMFETPWANVIMLRETAPVADARRRAVDAQPFSPGNATLRVCSEEAAGSTPARCNR
jgi:hypothetical protein